MATKKAAAAEPTVEKIGLHNLTPAIGSHRNRKRLGRVYVGRTVEEVYVKAPCAVLAYRQEEPK